MNRKCKDNENSEAFSFELPITSNGLFFGNALVEGFGCKENGKVEADIDNVIYENVEMKPFLEWTGGMSKIYAAAKNQVEAIFEEKEQLEIA